MRPQPAHAPFLGSSEDEDTRRRSFNTQLIAGGLALVMFVLFAANLLRDGSLPLRLLELVGAAIFTGIAVLAMRGRAGIAAPLLIGVSLTIIVMSVTVDQVLSAARIYCVVCLMIAGATMRPRGVLLTGVVVAAALLVMGPLGEETPAAPNPQSWLLDAIILNGMSGLIALLGAASSMRAVRRAQAHQEQILRAEQALRESERYYRLISENTDDLVALLDAGGRFLYVSPSYSHALGYPAGALLGVDALSCVCPEDQAVARACLQRAQSEGRAQASYRVAHADGTLRWIESSVTVARQHSEQFVVSVARNVTERRLLELQLQQAQRMEAMGRLAGGIAHDFNNLLVVINGSAELASEALAADHPAQEDLRAVHDAGLRAAALTRQLLAFARRQVFAREAVNLGEVVVELSRLLQRLIGESIRLETRVAPDLWLIDGDPVQIEQVIVNMVVNARDALPDGGLITISVTNVRQGPGGVDYVALTIADNGIGMSEDVQRQIFEPFFTTKAPDKGSGLGMAMCYGIVSQLGGSIQVSSAPGAGATFTVLLPRSTTFLTPDAPTTLAPPIGRATVLVVEDDAAVRALLVRAVLGHGFQVLEAPDAERALALAAEHEGQIDLVVCDVLLPGMNGAQLAAEISLRRPGIQVLLTSGHSDYVERIQGLLETGVAFVRKPWTPAQIGDRIREVLDMRLAKHN